MSLPDVIARVPDLRVRMAAYRDAGERIALVPTMGALHEGHLALARRGLEVAERVVVSIFVNPKQFGPNEDFNQYPRAGERDRLLLEGLADVIWAPTPEIMYPPGFSTTVSLTGPSQGFEGTMRPGHFEGVATVVAKLLTQVGPDVAIFGEKDWQQLQVVRRMVADLDLPLSILAHPTVRDGQGLALSSRNAYLSETELAVARRLNVILRRTVDDLAGGDWQDAIAKARHAVLEAGLGPIDYLAPVDAETMAPRDRADTERPARLVAAIRLGSIRLLDNMAIPAAS